MKIVGLWPESMKISKPSKITKRAKYCALDRRSGLILISEIKKRCSKSDFGAACENQGRRLCKQRLNMIKIKGNKQLY
jgi:hypothetical protein